MKENKRKKEEIKVITTLEPWWCLNEGDERREGDT